jgi:ATP-dependent Lhr-like helicase
LRTNHEHGPADLLILQESEIDAALLALEAEGFVLRGKFHPDTAQQEWCDRRLLARIHRLTIDRLRAEIQPVSIHDFYRFLFAGSEPPRNIGSKVWKACNPSWNSSTVASCHWLRGNRRCFRRAWTDYDPEWLDRLCFSGRIGWGRLSIAAKSNGRASAPLRTSPIALYLRENLAIGCS